MIDMYIKSPINLIPGIVSEVLNGYTGIGNLIAGNGPQVGTLDLRPLKYSDPMAGALGEFGYSLMLPGAASGISSRINALAPDLRGSPFLADQALSRGSAIPGSVSDPALRSGSYGSLVGELQGTGVQANHLNQNAAYRSVIPRSEGAAVEMRGNAFNEIGSPHYEFHSSLERFWDQYRRGSPSFGSLPTNAEYGHALADALKSTGMPQAEVARLSAQAAQNRAAFGLLENQPVPRIPSRLGQTKP